MGMILKRSFARGWVPSSDSVNGPSDGLLRADNLILDDQGIVSLRKGSAKINSEALADLGIHSLFTAYLSGGRYRMTGADQAVYANGVSIATGFPSSGDIAFGSAMGQVLMARSTLKKKYDGTTVRNWGIAPPSLAPTVAVLTADSKTFSTCASTELPVMTANEGTLAFAANRAGTANESAEVTPDATTGRGTITKTFAGATNFTVYDAAQVGSDEDLIDFYAYVTEVQLAQKITIMIDVNDGTFQEDYYWYDFTPDQTVDPILGTDQTNFIENDYTLEGFDRREIYDRIEERRQIVTSFRADKPVGNAGWNHFSIARGKMNRFGSTNGMNWSTVRAVRFTFQALAGGAGSAIRFDDWKIIGGTLRPMTGKYKWCTVGVYNSGSYQGKSAPSAYSSELELKGQGCTVTVTAPTVTALDTQVNEIWVFRMGGLLDGFYRTKVLTGGPFSGAQAIADTLSDKDALVTNIRLETDNAVPPDAIIDIEGPHYDRTLVLTGTHIYPSQKLNPDSFAAGEAIRVSDATETAYWIEKVNEEIYCGTSKDIYRLSGNWNKMPDGTVDVHKVGLGVGQPPISSATARDGDLLIYLASDGWRVLGQQGNLNGDTDLLYRGHTRHGVFPVNISGATARFRAAISNGTLSAITPEGSKTIHSPVLYRNQFARKAWYRHTYTRNWQAIYREPDGTLIAGDNEGFVWTLDTGTQDDGANIPVVMWTVNDDDGTPLNPKNATDLRTNLDISGDSGLLRLHKNDAAGSAIGLPLVGGEDHGDVKSLTDFTRVQFRLTGNFSTFKVYELGLSYFSEPQKALVWDSGPVDTGRQDITWMREIRIRVKPTAAITATPYFDGVPFAPYTIQTSESLTTIYSIPVGREYKGKQPRLVLTSAYPFQVYWAEWYPRVSGNVSQRKPVRVAVAA